MNEKIHIGKLIRDQLLKNGQSASWLSRQVYCDRSNFNKLLKRDHLDTALLLRISETMDYDFFSHYSKFLSEKRELDE